jgi:DNA-directed RNA polymerase specialized sigma24 family protein
VLKRKCTNPIKRSEATQYATRADFQHVFTEGMNNLYVLAFLLTNDARAAEQCFVAGLEDSAAADGVFREWALHWAKCAVIRNAIRMVQPQPEYPDSSSSTAVSFRSSQDAPIDPRYSALLSLCNFDRFVLVMTMLEGYSEHDCALLLGCTISDVHEARPRALRQIMRSSLDGTTATR